LKYSPQIEVQVPERHFFELPIKLVQFGEGRFIRAFLDYFIEMANHFSLFNGRAVVIQPQKTESAAIINSQDGLFTLCSRALRNGLQQQEFMIISSIKEAFAAKTDWLKILKIAELPSVEFIASNTTEAGIAYDPGDSSEKNPPSSFPGKILSFLYHRYQFFEGAPLKGLIVLPLELIENNGTLLRSIVLKLAKKWDLEENFIQWLENANSFYNSIVDRIVTGYPQEEELKEFQHLLGYEDKLFNVTELYHSWIIEADPSLQSKIPFDKAGLNVQFVSDITNYFIRKLRILNSAHTSMTPIAYLSNKNFVKEAIENANIEVLIQKMLVKEVIPFIDLPHDELIAYKDIIIERFHNPFIQHKLASISLYSISKMRLRVLPSIIAYYNRFQRAPVFLLFVFAAFLTFMRIREHTGSKWFGLRGSERYEYDDTPESLQFFYNAWNSLKSSKKNDLHKLIFSICKNSALWGMDLTQIPEFVPTAVEYVDQILKYGMPTALQRFLAQLNVKTE
jgi:tagaturonate reductase